MIVALWGTRRVWRLWGAGKWTWGVGHWSDDARKKKYISVVAVGRGFHELLDWNTSIKKETPPQQSLL